MTAREGAVTLTARRIYSRRPIRVTLGLEETETPEREPFHRACLAMSNWTVRECDQGKARLLINAGLIGLEDDAGRILELGKPRDRRDIGRVFRLGDEPALWQTGAIQLAELLTLIGRGDSR